MYHYGYSYFNDNFIFVADLIFYIYKIAISDDLSIHAADVHSGGPSKCEPKGGPL